ncbi:MAG TPA: hypothetical protein VLB07_02325 [Woeseiaceae bacterium]|nr:hypothetical protein [Woeseiaceae bacterium]
MSLARMVLIGLALAVQLSCARVAASSEVTGDSPVSLPESPYLSIKRDMSGISVSGQVSSVAHEAILRDVAAGNAPSSPVAFHLQHAEFLPPGWALVTELTLRAMLWTQFSAAEVTATGVSISGVTTDPASWNVARARLDASLLSGMRLDTRVIDVPSTADYTMLCRRQFDAVLKTRSLEFAVAASSLESGAEALLDGLIEAATDCPGAMISIRANGDGPASESGGGSANRKLGEARLQAIVDYLIRHGLPATRIKSLIAADAAAPHARAVSFVVSFAEVDDTGVADGVP